MVATLRIYKPTEAVVAPADLAKTLAAEAVQAAQTPEDPMKVYLDRLVKLIPGEVVGVYLTGSSQIPASPKIALLAWFIICLILVAVIRGWATRDATNNKPNPQWKAVGISFVSFIIWVYTMGGGPFAAYQLFVPWIGSLAVLLWTFIAPLIYQGEQRTPSPSPPTD